MVNIDLQPISVIIVNYNAGELILTCVAKALAQDQEVIVIDNNSTDFSMDGITTMFGNEPRLKTQYMIKNLGFATGCNIGLNLATQSNTRWSSDGFEIICFNGEKVYVAFSLDCHDRFAIDFVARKKPLLAEDIQDLMMSSILKRFNSVTASKIIQFLSDRGTIYRAKETIELGRHMNLKSCFTRPRTPQSNGMAESFVGAIKRDYVYTSDCFDADTVLKMLPEWINDYNEKAPHSGLGMLSPAEYIEKTKLGV